MIPLTIAKPEPAPGPTMEDMHKSMCDHLKWVQEGVKDILVSTAEATSAPLKGLPEAIKSMSEAVQKPPQITLPPLEVKIKHEMPPEQKGFMEVAKRLSTAIETMSAPKPPKQWIMEVDRDRNGMIRSVKAKQV